MAGRQVTQVLVPVLLVVLVACMAAVAVGVESRLTVIPLLGALVQVVFLELSGPVHRARSHQHVPVTCN